MASATWMASSRVGVSTSTWGVRWSGSRPIQQGQTEGRRLAGAGLGLADQVAAQHQLGDGGLLDRGGFLETDGRQALEQFPAQPEDGEGAGWEGCGLGGFLSVCGAAGVIVAGGGFVAGDVIR